MTDIKVWVSSCELCGVAFTRTQRQFNDGKMPACCSRACGRRLLAKREYEGKTCDLVWSNCVECGCSFARKDSRAYCSATCRGVADRRERVSNMNLDGFVPQLTTVWVCSCDACGRWFTRDARGPRGAGKADYCSRRCNPVRRVNARRAEQARRARKAGVPVGRVASRDAIGERDGWRCGICKRAVKPSLRYPNLMAPTLDHIIPLALGGAHSTHNLQIAHSICNSRKSATPAGDQLRLAV